MSLSDDPSQRRNWTDEELDLIVADYFSMLRDEAVGSAFNKAEHNRILRNKIDRSKASVEFKHRNISAVLDKLGVQPIKGYFPAQNFQAAITDAVERYVSRNPTVLHPERGASGFAERPSLFVEAPPKRLPISPPREDIERIVRRFNPVERDFRNRKLGRDGEELVLHFERQRLEAFDRPDLARKFDGFQRKMATAPAMTFFPSMQRARNDFWRLRQRSDRIPRPSTLRGTNYHSLRSALKHFVSAGFLIFQFVPECSS